MDTPAGPLVTGDWLDARLGDPRLVVLDATVYLDPPTAPDRPYDPRSGRAEWEANHIPGSHFADILGELSDQAAPYPFMLPSPQHFAEAMGRLGVDERSFVVAYDGDSGMWATRLWWMLRVFGHDRAAVLDGSLTAWIADGRSVTADRAPDPAPVTFSVRVRPELVANRDEVFSVIGDPGVLIVNTLSPELFRGELNRYGRPGRIPGSVNVPARSLLAADGRFLPPDGLRARLADSGALEAPRVIAYCGGGISATNGALALALLGRDDVAIYDGSLNEWAADPDLPLETG
jgi:thiosulfate/3-mercaptopyruvate sulfurtransferase